MGVREMQTKETKKFDFQRTWKEDEMGRKKKLTEL